METETLKINDILNMEHPEILFEQTRPFMELMMQYKCALREVQTKFEILNDEFTIRFNRNPVESIRTRIKQPLSILEKMRRHNLAITLDNIREYLNDVAGIRLVCSFPEDIYALADMLTSQTDITLISVKDYIKSPKPNGYRSLHMIIEVPIFLSSTTEIMRVEVQLRTIAMDFWASVDHKLKYKKGLEKLAAYSDIEKELKDCADNIAKIDLRMQNVMKWIDSQE